jgi:hypothetical protein
MCDDLQATVSDLAAKGVELAKEVGDVRWGRVTAVRLPGGGDLGLYEPRHPAAFDLRNREGFESNEEGLRTRVSGSPGRAGARSVRVPTMRHRCDRAVAS